MPRPAQVNLKTSERRPTGLRSLMQDRLRARMALATGFSRSIVWRCKHDANADACDVLSNGFMRCRRLQFAEGGVPDFAIVYAHLASLGVSWGDVLATGVRACKFRCVQWDIFEVDSVVGELTGMRELDTPGRDWMTETNK